MKPEKTPTRWYIVTTESGGSRTDKHTTTKSPLKRKRRREHKNSTLDIRYRAVLGVGMGGGSGMTTDREGMKGPNRIHSRLDQCQWSLYTVSKISERKKASHDQ